MQLERELQRQEKKNNKEDHMKKKERSKISVSPT
jgi:hypothetical protein